MVCIVQCRSVFPSQVSIPSTTNHYNLNMLKGLQYIIVQGEGPPESATQNTLSPVLFRATDLPSTSVAESRELSKPSEYKWDQNGSKLLIDLYAKYKTKVGTFQIKNIKMLWQKIADELRKININVTANNCLNRWRVLERNYKKFLENQNKTGRGRKYFEYEAEMAEIFGTKKNIYPEILLASDTIEGDMEKTSDTEAETTGNENIKAPSLKPLIPQQVKRKPSTIEKIRLDRKMYYDARLDIEREKLKEIKRRNCLIEERNTILKEKMCHCH